MVTLPRESSEFLSFLVGTPLRNLLLLYIPPKNFDFQKCCLKGIYSGFLCSCVHSLIQQVFIDLPSVPETVLATEEAVIKTGRSPYPHTAYNRVLLYHEADSEQANKEIHTMQSQVAMRKRYSGEREEG